MTIAPMLWRTKVTFQHRPFFPSSSWNRFSRSANMGTPVRERGSVPTH